MSFLPDCPIGLLSPFSAQPSIQTSQIDLSFLLSLILPFFSLNNHYSNCVRACACVCACMHTLPMFLDTSVEDTEMNNTQFLLLNSFQSGEKESHVGN